MPTMPVTLMIIAGVLHFGILIASALVPQVLDWRGELAGLPKLVRQMFWVHGAFIVMTIIAFGVLTLLNARAMASGETVLARSLCAFIAVFWGARLIVQFAVFDASPYTSTWLLRWGDRCLTIVFAYLAVIYCWSAVGAA